MILDFRLTIVFDITCNLAWIVKGYDTTLTRFSLLWLDTDDVILWEKLPSHSGKTSVLPQLFS